MVVIRYGPQTAKTNVRVAISEEMERVETMLLEGKATLFQQFMARRVLVQAQRAMEGRSAWHWLRVLGLLQDIRS